MISGDKIEYHSLLYSQDSQRAVSSMSSLASPAQASLNYPGGKVSLTNESKKCQARKPVKCVKRIKGKKGKPDTIDLLVQIDRVGGWLVGRIQNDQLSSV